MPTMKCPICSHENDPKAEECANCKAPLHDDAKTQRVDGPPPPLTKKESHGRDTQPFGTLAVYVLGQPAPIIVPIKAEIIIGRGSSDSTDIDIDLAPCQGGLLGVSRRHAGIYISNDGFLIEDLNSTNGTWLNQNRLYPIQPRPLFSGDHIRLGHLDIFVHFSQTPHILKEKVENPGNKEHDPSKENPLTAKLPRDDTQSGQKKVSDSE